LANIKGGPKTTITGALIAVYALYSLYISTGTVEYTLYGGLFTVGFVCFFLKDYNHARKARTI